MAAFVKFNILTEHLAGKVHDLLGTAGSTADVCKVYLSNTTPNTSTHAVKGDLAEISAGNGYTAGGESIQNVGTRTGGTFTMVGTKVTWTAGPSAMATFRYVPLYNDTPTSPADPLIGYWDRGAQLDLQNGETFSVKFSGSDTSGDVLVLA